MAVIHHIILWLVEYFDSIEHGPDQNSRPRCVIWYFRDTGRGRDRVVCSRPCRPQLLMVLRQTITLTKQPFSLHLQLTTYINIWAYFSYKYNMCLPEFQRLCFDCITYHTSSSQYESDGLDFGYNEHHYYSLFSPPSGAGLWEYKHFILGKHNIHNPPCMSSY